MPSDIETFAMLRPSILADMTDDQLLQELVRVTVMVEKVSEYAKDIVFVINGREKSNDNPS